MCEKNAVTEAVAADPDGVSGLMRRSTFLHKSPGGFDLREEPRRYFGEPALAVLDLRMAHPCEVQLSIYEANASVPGGATDALCRLIRSTMPRDPTEQEAVVHVARCIDELAVLFDSARIDEMKASIRVRPAVALHAHADAERGARRRGAPR